MAPTVPAPTIPAPTVPAPTIVDPTAPTTLHDDTGLLVVDVPAAWSQVTTTPVTTDAGATIPQIIAATDHEGFVNGYTAPGLLYFGASYQADTRAGLAAQYDFGASCTAGPVTDYHDGYFVNGSTQTWSGCGGGATRIVTVFANPADESFSAVVLVQLTDADDEPLDTVLGSFWVTEPTTAYVTDDASVIEMAVPAAWADVWTSTPPGSSATAPLTVGAGPDGVAFRAFTGPGVEATAVAYTADPAAAIAALVPAGCVGGAPTPFARQGATGVIVEADNCNGRHLTLIGLNEDGRTDYTLTVVQLTDPADDLARRVVRNSAGLIGLAATAPVTTPVTTAAAAPVTTAVTTAATAPVTTAAAAPVTTAVTAPVTTGVSVVATTAVPVTTAVPMAVTELIDDNDVLSVSVPASWTFVDTAPTLSRPVGSGGASSSRIVAATAPDWETNAATSSLAYTAYRFVADLDGALSDAAPDCAPGPVTPYDDGYFVGLRQDFTGCAGDHVVNVVANPPDGSFTAMLSIWVTPADEAAIDVVLSTFHHGGTTPYYHLVDETGLLTLDVPNSWSSWNVDQATSGEGATPHPAIWASTPGDDAATDTYVWYEAFPAGDPAELLPLNDESARCTDGGTTAYTDGYFTGVTRTWTNCDGNPESRLVQVFALSGDATFTAALRIQLVGQSDDVLALLLDSFYVENPAVTDGS